MTSAASAIDAPRGDGFWRRLGWSLWPSRCLVCAEAGIDGCDLCRACEAAWPWMGAACLRCAMPLASAAASDSPALCGACLRQPALVTELHAACAYRAPLDRLLPRFKFHRDLAAGRLLATMMARSFAAKFASDRPPALDPRPDARAAPGCESTHAADRPGRGSSLARDPARAVADIAGTSRTSPLRASAGSPSVRPAPVLIPIPLHPARLRQRGYDQALELTRPFARALRLPVLADALVRQRDTPAQSRLDAAQRRRNLRDAFAWRERAPPPAHAILIDDVMTTGATLHAAARTLRRAGVQRVDAWVCARVL
ncbi:ComF family protein [Pseudomonas sp. CGJS7]|uniref:ComF family protein n=1 Tax=Pseudomonas sp. CGJS7 TaxID=3109348 RepID=UPI00300A6941